MLKQHRVAVNLTGSEYTELVQMADKYGVSFAWLGRQALSEFLSRYRNEQLELPITVERRALSSRGTDDHAA